MISPSIGADGVPTSAVSDPIDGEASGAGAAPQAPASGAPSERFIVTSAAGEHVVRTNELSTARRYAHVLRGEILDLLTGAAA